MQPRQDAFDVYLPYGHGKRYGEWKWIETVYADFGGTSDEIRRSLIEHDGFRSDIKVVKRQWPR
jgi:hypothetical protein